MISALSSTSEGCTQCPVRYGPSTFSSVRPVLIFNAFVSATTSSDQSSSRFSSACARVRAPSISVLLGSAASVSNLAYRTAMCQQTLSPVTTPIRTNTPSIESITTAAAATTTTATMTRQSNQERHYDTHAVPAC
eukprot:4960680-Pleurochrysis_carterae.AAC.12